jgi:acyl-CoA dehydrogenase
VPPGTLGLGIGRKLTNRGIPVPHTVEVILEDVRVPGHCLLGGKERLDERLARARGATSAGRPATTVFEAFHPVMGAHALGIARAAYDYALDYAKEHKRYGRPLVDDEVIAFKLADMKTSTDAARLLVWRAGWMASTGQPFEAAEGRMSKLYAGANAVWVTDQAIQIAGRVRYMPDYPLERWQRDATSFTILESGPISRRLTIARANSGMRLRWPARGGKHAATD